jgi:hypothetical protein
VKELCADGEELGGIGAVGKLRALESPGARAEREEQEVEVRST